MMELLDFPEEILTKILSYLDQRHLHLREALVCKRFLRLTKSPQLIKCVNYLSPYEDLNGISNMESLMVMLRNNKHLEKLTLERCLHRDMLEILKVVVPHGTLRHLELNMEIIDDNDIEEWRDVFSQIFAKLTTFHLYSMYLYFLIVWLHL
jgi:hypothetical protein